MMCLGDGEREGYQFVLSLYNIIKRGGEREKKMVEET